MNKPRESKLDKLLTARQAAERLGVCVQRVNAKVKQGHFPNHRWCECGHSILIPESEIKAAEKLKKERKR